MSLLTCPSASAQRSVLRRPALHWVRGPGTESCVSPRTLAAAVEELVGPVLVRPAEAENSIEGQVEALPTGSLKVRLRVLKLRGDSGERVLEHPSSDCAAITPAIVFVVAMMIDPGVAAHGLPPELLALLGAEVPEEALLAELDETRTDAPPPAAATDAMGQSGALEPPPAAPPPRPRPPVPQASDEEVPQRARVREDLGVQAALLVRLSLREAAGPLWSGEERMLFELRRPLSLAAHVRGGAQAGEHAFDPQREERTIRISIIAAGLALCAGHTGEVVLRLNGCLGGEVSGALARGAGLTEQRASFRGDGAVVAQLTARLRVYRQWGVGLFVNGRLSLVRRRFTIEDMNRARQPAYTMERPSISLGLGPTYEF